MKDIQIMLEFVLSDLWIFIGFASILNTILYFGINLIIQMTRIFVYGSKKTIIRKKKEEK